jgi:uncharacterized protein (DUF1810 family)
MEGDGDPFYLVRFVAAQESMFPQALGEVRRGEKRSHWMWYIFPQLTGLGASEMARRYAITSIEEASAFLAHPILGPRYREIIAALQDLETADAQKVFGPVDAQKLRSSLTLFAMASKEPLIAAALDRWAVSPDPATLAAVRPIRLQP